jgi:hypothetical protein
MDMTTTHKDASDLHDINDRRAVRELIENWAIWRDAGDWERFRTVWHDDGRMNATWKQGTAAEFIEGWNRGCQHPSFSWRNLD